MCRRFAFLLFAVLLAAAPALAQSNGAVAPPTQKPDAAPRLSGEQQDKIRDSVRNAKVDHVAKIDVPMRVGAEVPRNLHFYPFPKEVTEIVPEYAGYFYVVAAEKIVVIDPLSYRVVAILPV